MCWIVSASHIKFGPYKTMSTNLNKNLTLNCGKKKNVKYLALEPTATKLVYDKHDPTNVFDVTPWIYVK
jgi:hypothetical protein